VVHRDLKPANVFLMRDGVVKVLDFGIAKVLRALHQTAVGVTLGTPQYMAPEQIRMGGTVGPPTDIYALGVVLFRIVTGRLPFNEHDKRQVLELHLTERAPSAGQLALLSPELDRLIAACLEKEPAARPASMAAVRDELKRIEAASREPSLPIPLPPSRGSAAPEQLTPATATERPKAGAARAGAVSAALATTAPAEAPAAATTTPQRSSEEATATSVARRRMVTVPMALVAALVVGLGVAAAFVLRGGRVAPAPVAVGGAPAHGPAAPTIDLPAPAPRPTDPPAPTRTAEPPAPAKSDQRPAPAAIANAPAKGAPRHRSAGDGPPGRIQVRSEPAGATVIVDRAVRGVTPLSLALPLPSELLLTLPGYQPATAQVKAAGAVRVKLVPLAPRSAGAAPAAEGLD
jgi:serine/threonine-protein kinase